MKKLHKNKSFDQIVDELEEGADVVQPLYDFVLKHIDLNEDEMVQKYLENIEYLIIYKIWRRKSFMQLLSPYFAS